MNLDAFEDLLVADSERSQATIEQNSKACATYEANYPEPEAWFAQIMELLSSSASISSADAQRLHVHLQYLYHKEQYLDCRKGTMELLRAYDRRAIKTKKGSLGEIDMLDLVMNADLKSGNGVCTMNEADMALSCCPVRPELGITGSKVFVVYEGFPDAIVCLMHCFTANGPMKKMIFQMNEVALAWLNFDRPKDSQRQIIRQLLDPEQMSSLTKEILVELPLYPDTIMTLLKFIRARRKFEEETAFKTRSLSEEELRQNERIELALCGDKVYRVLQATNAGNWRKSLSVDCSSLVYATLASEHWTAIMTALRKEILLETVPGATVPFSAKDLSHVDGQALYAAYTLFCGFFSLGMTIMKNINDSDLLIVHELLRSALPVVGSAIENSPLDAQHCAAFLDRAVTTYCSLLYHNTSTIQYFTSKRNIKEPERVLGLPSALGCLLRDINACRTALLLHEHEGSHEMLILCDIILALSGLSSEHYTTDDVRANQGLMQADSNNCAQAAKDYLNRNGVTFNSKGRHASPCCSNCGKTKERADGLRYCGGCNLLRYCDTECGKQHWKSGHKTKCNKMTLKK